MYQTRVGRKLIDVYIGPELVENSSELVENCVIFTSGTVLLFCRRRGGEKESPSEADGVVAAPTNRREHASHT